MRTTTPPGYIANFDSASAMIRSLARFLKGKDFPTLGLAPVLKAIVPIANALPKKAREVQYATGGWGEAYRGDKLHKVKAERVAEWMVDLYPRDRKYPAVVVGSASGALVHLCAALGIPWLPQTYLIPVRQPEVHPDDVGSALDSLIEPGRRLLEANPDLQLHFMHDPNQDRLMLHLMNYFRVKRRTLGQAYELFLLDRLEDGGTIFIADCQRTWPVTKIDERFYFQMGALGGASPEEFLHGSERVADYLKRYGSHRRRWMPPIPDTDAPEAEWGFETALRDDVERFARKHGFQVRTIGFEEPEHLSPLVADLYRWWYRERGYPGERLLVESFILHEPWWTFRLGAAPFWMKFNMDPSADYLEQYLDERTQPYDYIHMMLFSHGVDCVGLAPIERWRAILGRALREGTFVGVDEEKYPRDFATFSRYHTELKKLSPRYPLPGPLALSQFEKFLQSYGGRYEVEFSQASEQARQLQAA